MVDIFALGAAKGYLSLRSKDDVSECLGNLTAKDFLLFVTNLEILEFFFNFNTNVKGPGQNLL